MHKEGDNKNIIFNETKILKVVSLFIIEINLLIS